MTTRSEDFKARSQRAAQAKHPHKIGRRRDVIVDPARPGVSATDPQAVRAHTAGRNFSKRSAKVGIVALEDSLSGSPSRKSSRGSANRQKSSTPLERRQVQRLLTPGSKASRGKKGR